MSPLPLDEVSALYKRCHNAGVIDARLLRRIGTSENKINTVNSCDYQQDSYT